MARVGVSQPVYAPYSIVSGAVKYGGATTMGKATSFDISLDSASDNNLYADNAIAETDAQFGGGTLTVGLDDLYDAAVIAMLGVTNNNGELIRKSGVSSPYVGVGGIVKHIQSGTTRYTGVILTKVQFQDPGISVTTQGETIDWQTPEISATIMRDDTTDAVWMRQKTFDTEAAAASYISTFFAATT